MNRWVNFSNRRMRPWALHSSAVMIRFCISTSCEWLFIGPSCGCTPDGSTCASTGETSLGYGALIVALGWTLLVFCGTHPYFIAAAISGFLLVGPLMSAGFCEISRRYSLWG